jgi:replicative DNA helicase
MAKVNKEDLSYLTDDFQQRLILQMITDRKFGTSIIDILEPNYFKDNYLKIIVAEIKNAYDKHEAIPDLGSLKSRVFEKNTTEVEVNFFNGQFAKIEKATLNDTLYVQETAMKFCKRQELKKAIKEIDVIITNGRLDEYDSCENILRKALDKGDNKDDSIEIFENIDDVLDDDYRNPIPTGISGLDTIMGGGLAKGELAVILAAFGIGKAQPLSSNVLTPNGWVKMGDIKIGSEVISRDGNATKVIGVYPQGIRPIYRVSFNDSTSALCDKEHLWSVNTINQRNRSTKKNGKYVSLPSDNSFKTISTSEMIGKTKVWNGKRYNFKIPNVEPVNFNKKDLIVEPYLLGVILGDGCITTSNQPNFVNKDIDIINEVKRVYDNVSVTELFRTVEKEINGELVLEKRSIYKASLLGIKNDLIRLNLYGCGSSDKFIPKDYLYSSVEDRVRLLQGLVDTDGYIHKHTVEISTVSKEMSENIKELVLSLGGRISIKPTQGKYKKNGIVINTKIYYRISFSFPDNGVIPALCGRKVKNFTPRTKYGNNKFITSIEYSHDEEAQCIMVDNNEHLYVTDDFIVTHNTTMFTKMANHAYNEGYNVLQIFFEDMPKVIQRKHIACWTGINLSDLGEHKEEIKETLEKVKASTGKLKLKKFPSSDTTITTIKQYIRKQIASGFRPDIIMLDYIDCVQPSKKVDDVNVGEGQVMREFESMLSELEMAGWTAVQGNRSAISSTIVESDQMGGSIKKGQIGHFIVSIAKSLEQKENGTANMAILKSRFGKDGLVFEDIVFNNGTIQIEMNSKNNNAISVSNLKNNKKTSAMNKVNSLMDAGLKARENN